MKASRRSVGAVLLVLTSLAFTGLFVIPAQANCHTSRFANPAPSVNENAGTVQVTVDLIGETTQCSGTMEYETVQSEKAERDKDYKYMKGEIKFDATNVADLDYNSETITIPIMEDTLFEGDEKFQVVVTSKSGGISPPNNGPAIVTIKDNDPSPAPSPTRTQTQSPSPSPTPTKASPSPSPSPSPTPAATLTAGTSPSPSPPATTTPEVAITQEDGGAPVGLIVGISALVLAAGAGVGLWFLRRTPA